MPEEFGIKETKEVLIAANEVGVVVIKAFKDGVQIGDFVTFWNTYKDNAEFKAALEAAWDKAGQVPKEIGNLNLSESVDLVLTQVAQIPKLIDALK